MHAPEAPDPVKTAAAQSGLNSTTAQTQQAMNMVNQSTPYGSLNYNQTGQQFISDPTAGQQYWVDSSGQYHSSLPTRSVTTPGSSGSSTGPVRYDKNGQPINDGSSTSSSKTSNQAYTPDGWTSVKGNYVPTYTATQTLSPTQQQIFDNSQQAQINLSQLASDQSGRLGSLLGQPMPTLNAPAAFKGPTSLSNNDVENWAYDLASPRILKQQGQDQDQLRSQLINSGLRPGTQQWDSEMSRLTNANSDQLNQLALNGRSMAVGEQNQTFNQGLAQQNQGYNQALQTYNSAVQARNQPINEILALSGASQIVNPNTSYAQTPQAQVANTDYSGLVQQNYQQQVAQTNAQNGALGGLFGAATSLLPFSDARLKTDIRRVGSTDGGTPVYTYRYIGHDMIHMGVMAQEVPEACVIDPSGYFRVDYSKVQ